MRKEAKAAVPQETTVTPSPAMIPPSREKLLERRTYPSLPIPPAAHARAWYEPERGVAGLTYNGHDLFTFHFPGDIQPTMRYHSDGNFISTPFLQQFVLSSPSPASIRVDCSAPVELWSMRPRRARDGEAILGQVGAPLLYGVNGLYMPDWDLLVSWHGYPFHWTKSVLDHNDTGWHASMDLELNTKPWVILFQPRYYAEHLGFSQHKPWAFRPKAQAITGWCSWEAYHSEVCQQDIDDAAQALQPLRAYGLSTMQLDDGYQQMLVPLREGAAVGDSWMHTNEKFPEGHAAIVGAMHGGGFEAGIWTNATLTHKKASESGGCCLRNAQGELLQGDWIQFVLDCLPDTLAKHVTPYYRALREAGYTYFKSDSLRHLIYDGMQEAVRLGLMDDETARERQHAYMMAARKGIGVDAYYLSCWGVLSQSIGLCDAMRVATDSNPSWGAFSMQLRETARWFGTQRVLFTLDPDVVCVRGPQAWARMLLSLVALSGGVMMISDNPALYDAERLSLIQRTIPGLTTRAAETGPIDYTTPACCSTAGRDEETASFDIAHITDTQIPFSSLWCTHFEQNGRRWSVLQRCAVVPLEAVGIGVEALSLDPDSSYMAFDYWHQSVVSVPCGRVALPALALGDTTVYALVETHGNLPVLLGSDRHVSMDMVSVAAFEAGPHRAALTLRGFPNLTVRYTLYAPSLTGGIRQATGCSATCNKTKDILTVTVSFQADECFVLLV